MRERRLIFLENIEILYSNSHKQMLVVKDLLLVSLKKLRSKRERARNSAKLAKKGRHVHELVKLRRVLKE